jgi:enterochelin esterase-like enzyme
LVTLRAALGGEGPVTRRAALGGAAAGLAGLAVAGLELVAHGVLPGQHVLDRLEGACDAAMPPQTTAPAGPSRSGVLRSHARGREVAYTISYPPGHGPGDELPLALCLHAFGGDHASTLGGLSLAAALAASRPGRPRPPIALASADGGNGYWNAHPGDDPMAMLVDELLPICRDAGLGRERLGAIGISMGGYGALLLAERHPRLIDAVAAISPAVWTTYADARGVNPGAYASAGAFAHDDVVTHAAALSGIPTRVASGDSDPFHPGVQALARRLPASATVVFGSGCHDGSFFAAQRSPSLDFLAAHL